MKKVAVLICLGIALMGCLSAGPQDDAGNAKGLMDYSNAELVEIMQSNDDLQNFMARNSYEIADKEVLNAEGLAELQAQEDAYGEWYRRMPGGGELLQLRLVSGGGMDFLVVLDPAKGEVVDILALIGVNVG